MHDTKSTPTASNMPGVELHTTFINNLINNEFITRVNIITDILITVREMSRNFESLLYVS